MLFMKLFQQDFFLTDATKYDQLSLPNRAKFLFQVSYPGFLKSIPLL